MLSALADFVYLVDEKTAGNEIDEPLPDDTALIGKMEIPEFRLWKTQIKFSLIFLDNAKIIVPMK